MYFLCLFGIIFFWFSLLPSVPIFELGPVKRGRWELWGQAAGRSCFALSGLHMKEGPSDTQGCAPWAIRLRPFGAHAEAHPVLQDCHPPLGTVTRASKDAPYASCGREHYLPTNVTHQTHFAIHLAALRWLPPFGVGWAMMSWVLRVVTVWRP